MRKLIIVAIAGLALILAGCTTGTNGNGQQKIDTQAFFPNDQDNYWQYERSGVETGDVTWAMLDDPGYQLTYDLQRVHIHNDSDPDDTWVDRFITDDEDDSLEYTGYMSQIEGDLDQNIMWNTDPWTLLFWDDYGISVGDTWDAWDVSNLPTDFYDYDPPDEIDSLGFKLDAEVTDTEDFDYNGTTLTAYVIEFTGFLIYEDDEVDQDDWIEVKYQEDYYFVPEFGWVKIQMYEQHQGILQKTTLYTLIDTNVPIPD